MTENLPKFNRTFLNVERDEAGKVVAFDIDRRYWERGNGLGSLLNPETQKMCCLGFYSLACGLTYKEIENQDLPSSVRLRKEMEWLTEESVLPFDKTLSYSEYEDALAYINDESDLKNSDRERKIKARFAKNGITVNFVN